MEIVLKIDGLSISGLEEVLQKCVISHSLSASPQEPLTNLDHLSWGEIDQIGKAGKARQWFAVGATKQDHMKDGWVSVWQIIGFDHDDLADGSGKAPISWDMVHVYKEDRYMNDNGRNTGGFVGSDVGEWLNTDFLSRCSDELQAIIKPVIKLTSAGNGSKEIFKEKCMIWLKCESELYGRCFYSVPGEGRWYEYYRQEGVPYYKTTKDGDCRCQLLRSPNYNSATHFCFVDPSGNAYYNSSRCSYGLPPAFCT